MVGWKVTGVPRMLVRTEQWRHATMMGWGKLRPVSIGRMVSVLAGATHMTESYQLIGRVVLVRRPGVTEL